MGVFTERLAVLFLMPWSSRSASRPLETKSRQAYGTQGGQAAPEPMWKMDRQHSPSTSVQRADLEALRAFSRVR